MPHDECNTLKFQHWTHTLSMGSMGVSRELKPNANETTLSKQVLNASWWWIVIDSS